MALIINFKGQYKGLLPNVAKQAYRYGAFEGDTLTATYRGGVSKSVDVTEQLTHAWNFVLERAKIPDGECNTYFKTLPRGMTLKQVIEERDIVIHSLVPKEDYTYADLPAANSAGRDIGINPAVLFEASPHSLACTLVHELAHVAGASTNKSGPNALQAEESLHHCRCSSQYNKESVGFIEKVRYPRETRYV